MMQRLVNWICSICDDPYRLVVFGALQRPSSCNISFCTPAFLSWEQLPSREKNLCLFHIQTSRGSPGERSGFGERIILPIRISKASKPVLLLILPLGGNSLAESRNCLWMQQAPRWVPQPPKAWNYFHYKARKALRTTLSFQLCKWKLTFDLAYLSWPDNVP